jgi:hypothetical protein
MNYESSILLRLTPRNSQPTKNLKANPTNPCGEYVENEGIVIG